MISSTSDEQFDRSWIWIGAIGSVGFLLLSIFYYDFVLDDAYIIYRYAENLVAYGSFTWNVGEKPVEGFTSFLWVILNASAIVVGADPIVFTKVISLAAALLIIWLLAYNSRTAPLEVAAIATFAIALSPPAVLLTWQGLETAFLSLLLLLSALFSIRVVTRANARQMVWWYLIAFIAILTRPDSVAFTGGVGLGIVLVLLIDKRRDAVRLFFMLGLIWLAAVAVYVAWRYRYFGYLFPNTFYVKANPTSAFGQLSTTGFAGHSGLLYTKTFFTDVLFPYLVLFLAMIGLRPQVLKDRGLQIAPILVGSVIFGAYLLRIIHIQGFLWRYIFPLFPVFLLGMVWLLSNQGRRLWLGHRFVSYVLIGLFVVWSLQLKYVTSQEKAARTQHSRVQFGKHLAGMSGTVFLEESGAVPYYSGWRSVDILGLNSEEIAHRGLSLQMLEELNPDLVFLMIEGRYNSGSLYGERGAILHEYLTKRPFVAAAVIHKAFDTYHFVFVNRDSPQFAAIVERVTSVPDVVYLDLEEKLAGESIPTYAVAR